MFDISAFPRGVRPHDPDEAPPNRPLNAFWRDPSELASNERWQYDPKKGKVFLGCIGNQLIGIKDDRHLMTVAGSRAGKGVSTVIPNLIEYRGSVLVIDPKAENAKRTASRRGHGSKWVKEGLGQKVFVLDPFGDSRHLTAHYNPLLMINPDSATAVDDASLIAEAIIIPGEGEMRHFSDSARNYIRGLILYMRTTLPEGRCHLPHLRTLLTLDGPPSGILNIRNLDRKEGEPPPTGLEILLHEMARNDKCEGAIQRAANSLALKSERERSGVISTAIEQTDFLDSPLVAGTLTKSDFKLSDLKETPTTVYLCLPARFMATHNRWLRIIVNQAVAAMENEIRPDPPVLFLMDEFAVLDHLSSIEKAAGQIAGLGMRLWPILQDLSQLKSIYKDRWETFMGNAGVMQFFGNNDLTTLEYLAKRLGKSTIERIKQGEVTQQQEAQAMMGQTVELHETELMSSDEIGIYFSRQRGTQLILYPGSDPIAMGRVQYRRHPFFAGKYDYPDEDF